MTGFGPIFQLQVLGTICPCLEKSEHKNARHAVTAINRACRRVQWHPGSGHGSGGTMGGFFGGLFGKGGDPAGGGSGPTSAGWAKIVLRDSGGDGQPELFVDPIQNTVVSPATTSTTSSTTPQQTNLQRSDAGYKLNIKLRRVDKVTLDGATGQIILTAKKVGGREAVAKELLRFTLLQQNDSDDSNDNNNAAHHDSAAATTVVPVTSDVRNAIVHHFMVITEWERQRCAERQKSDPDGYYSDNDDDDDENQPNFLQARAQKAAHFAKREVEMQRIKKERDRRKAELVAESGGLKYTAIAMANMQK